MELYYTTNLCHILKLFHRLIIKSHFSSYNAMHSIKFSMNLFLNSKAKCTIIIGYVILITAKFFFRS